jgi:drug/metabolite transporter (DMT)-like permease
MDGIAGHRCGDRQLSVVPLASFDLADTVSGSEVLRFVGWALVMGLAGSWLATWFWVFASRRLPLALATQLIVAETPISRT